MCGRLHAFARLVVSFVVLGALAVVLTAPARAAEGDSVEVDIRDIDNSGISGTAVITDEGESVKVEIEVSGSGVVGGHPVHLHQGSCSDNDPFPTYPLADIDADGLSSTIVDGVTLDELLTGGFVINVHRSVDNLLPVAACGEIVAPEAPAAETSTEAAAAATGVGSSGEYNPPSAGVGSAVRDGGSNLLLATLIGLAAIFATAGVALRRRENRG